MGYFANLEIDVIEMFREDGMKETEIAASLGIPVVVVHEVIARWEAEDYDRDPDMVSYDDLAFDPCDSNYNSEQC
jgi:transposase